MNILVELLSRGSLNNNIPFRRKLISLPINLLLNTGIEETSLSLNLVVQMIIEFNS